LLLAFCLPGNGATPLALHVGSTRDWVKKSGIPVDSVRYRLEFLDSSEGEVISEAPTWVGAGANATFVYEYGSVDWRVRITIPDSPSVEDTAVVRVVQARRFAPPNPGTYPQQEFRFKDLAMWTRPSIHFPLDIQNNPGEEVAKLAQFWPESTGLLQRHLYTGSWQATLAFPDRREGTTFDGGGAFLCENTRSFTGGTCTPSPSVSVQEGVGIVTWVGGGARWELRQADGTPIPQISRNRSPYPLVPGETWVYREITKHTSPAYKMDTGFVNLRLLESLDDSDGWTRLSLTKVTLPASGIADTSTFHIRVSRTLHEVWTWNAEDTRLTPVDGGPSWILPRSFVGRWALGLIEPSSSSSQGRTLYGDGEYQNQTQSEMDPCWYSSWDGVHLQEDSGAVELLSSYSAYQRLIINSSWESKATLWSHALVPEGASARRSPSSPQRNLVWLRAHLESHPDAELVRTRPDGTRARGRGAAATELLRQRGVALLQVWLENELISIRVVQP